jgi:O-antigen/teichoic acid export membrane protein
MVMASALIIAFRHYQKRDSEVPSMLNWKVTHTAGKKLLRGSWPLMFSGLALSIYMRIDQIMLRMMVDISDLGKYSAATRVAESWLFFAVIITTTFFPAILNAKNTNETMYLQRLQKFYDLMLWFPIFFAGGICFFADDIILIAFGKEFYEAGSVLKIYAWAGVFVFMITASSRWFITEGFEKSILYRALAGAVLNVILNIVLIPLWGIDGAALATLFSYGGMAFVYDAMDPCGHVSFRMKLRSLGAPLRLIKERLEHYAGS